MANIMVQLQKLANENTAKTFKYNKQEAEISRSWQKMMSDTSHQREVADLKKAGLNPVLSANSGAQSYSTQSASAVADSAVNAIGNVQSSINSASATRYAADRSLAASQAIASAQRYAAAMSYEASKYHSDLAYKSSVYSADRQKEIAQINYNAKVDTMPVRGVISAVNKALANTGVNSAIRTEIAPRVANFARTVAKGADSLFSKFSSGANGAFKLSKNGVQQVNSMLAKINVASTSVNRQKFVQAFIFGDTDAQKYMNSIIKTSNRNFRNSARTGSGVW